MAVIPDISCDGSEVQLWLSYCRASHTAGSLLPLPKAVVVDTLLFPTMVGHKPCEILAKSTVMALSVKKCLYSDLTIRLSYCSFCRFKGAAEQKLGVLGHCWTCSSSPFQPECKADIQRDVECSVRPLVQGSVAPLHPFAGGKLSVPFRHTGPSRRGVHWCFLRVGGVKHQVFVKLEF